MTDKEFKEKYSIGTKIRFLDKYGMTGDRGKEGTIVNYHYNYPIIFLPKSKHISEFSTEQIPATWETGWNNLEILSQKNQQLLFSFMQQS